MVFSCARGTPILAGGIGVARLVAGAVFCCLFGQVYVSVFACNATGLDAVRRLEQKKVFRNLLNRRWWRLFQASSQKSWCRRFAGIHSEF